MIKPYIGIIACLLLTGCSSGKMETSNTITTFDAKAKNESMDNTTETAGTQEIIDEESVTAKSAEDPADREKFSDLNLNSYSGDWVLWNNPDMESDGGISLSLTVSGRDIKADISAWSPDYNRLADTNLSGSLQGNYGGFYYDDDGRGHAGTVYLTLENDVIQVEVVTDKTNANGDFTFPGGKITLQKKQPDSNIPVKNDLPIDSDKSFPLFIYPDSKTAGYSASYSDSYDTIKEWIDEGEHGIWEEYSEYTVLNKKDIWPDIKNSDDYMKHASIMQTLIEADQQYTLVFIDEAGTKSLCSAFTSSPDVTSQKGIQCGDSVEDIESAYGKNYAAYNTGKYIIFEYKTSNGYLRFSLNPQTNTITQWGIDKYSTEDRSNTPRE